MFWGDWCSSPFYLQGKLGDGKKILSSRPPPRARAACRAARQGANRLRGRPRSGSNRPSNLWKAEFHKANAASQSTAGGRAPTMWVPARLNGAERCLRAERTPCWCASDPTQPTGPEDMRRPPPSPPLPQPGRRLGDAWETTALGADTRLCHPTGLGRLAFHHPPCIINF